jgi:hypothetical protein
MRIPPLGSVIRPGPRREGKTPAMTAPRSSIAVYQTGNASSVKIVEEIKPPIIAAAMDWM